MKALSQLAQSVAYGMAVSRFHDHLDMEVYATQNEITKHVAIDSPLKSCSLAAGEVDFYPRLVSSEEWDAMAGQTVLEAAGGQVLGWHAGMALQYGKRRCWISDCWHSGPLLPKRIQIKTIGE